VATTITHPTLGTVTLPPDLLWQDEFAWQQVQQTTTYTTTGAIIIESAAKQAGRPITLQGEQEYAWCQRDVLSTLKVWAGQAGQVLTLSLRGSTHTVVFDHAANAIQATPIVPYAEPVATDRYQITLKFLEL
jgi:hypothetical protein